MITPEFKLVGNKEKEETRMEPEDRHSKERCSRISEDGRLVKRK